MCIQGGALSNNNIEENLFSSFRSTKELILTIIPLFAVAMLLSFGRGGFMPFIYNTAIDQIINIIIVVIAPLAIIIKRYSYYEKIFNSHLIPILILFAYIAGSLLQSNPNFRPTFSTLISIYLVIFLGSHVSISQLRLLRLLVLLVGFIFSLFILFVAKEEMYTVLSGTLINQFGIDYSDALLVAYPRMLYVITLTGIVSAIIEKNIFVKIIAIAITICPSIISLATGGRGALVGLLCAIIVFVISLNKGKLLIIGIISIVVILFIGNYFISEYLPIMAKRIETGDDAGRFNLYNSALSNISLFGLGKEGLYPHNVFIEFLSEYGILGLAIFLYTISRSIIVVFNAYLYYRNIDVLWLISIYILQFVAQQFSLDIFYPMFWAPIVIPFGLLYDFKKR